MYLQITTKCNMKCAHCCYSCSMKGKHADYETVIDMISFARNFDPENIAIGGGEPTLHPRFFDILKCCLDDFDFVWFATNGSQTEKMFRISNIIDGEDYPECECSEEDIENGYCNCFDNRIYQEDKLSVALSLDCFHAPIDKRVEDLWKRKSKLNMHSHYEIRNVSNSYFGIIAEGRAKKTQTGQNEDSCVCSDIMIKPNGSLKLCGCKKSPVIGNVYDGISEKWENVLYENDDFNDSRCYKALKTK